METKEVTVKEYIEKLPKDIEPFVKNQPYFAFFIIASGIEFLGKCINNESDWQKEQMSRDDFEGVIKELDSFSNYRRYLKKKKRCKIDLYSSLRCGLLHAMLPKSDVLLMRGHEPIGIKNNKLILSIETMYNDFCNACGEILSSKCNHLWTKKKKNDVFLYIADNQEQGYYQASGSTAICIAQLINNAENAENPMKSRQTKILLLWQKLFCHHGR